MKNKKLQILADENMPHIEQLFGGIASVKTKSGREITQQDLLDCDALLCRSITQVNQTLLQGTPVKFVGTATIGIDHLDTKWLEQNDIQWTNAAGCNAEAVVQYVISAIAFWLKQSTRSLADIRVGIVGAGNVGSGLARALDILGVNYLLCDPPLQRAKDSRAFVPIDDIWSCDVVTFHVPLQKVDEDSTFHLLNENQLANLKREQLVINASRGGVVDNDALDIYLERTDAAAIVLDVFENEPNINYELAKKCLLATPHIAGHTLEGKSRGSFMIYQKLCEFFECEQNIQESDLYPEKNNLASDTELQNKKIVELLLHIYDIKKDSDKLCGVNSKLDGQFFDQLRKDYPEFHKPNSRRDYSGWQAVGNFPQTIVNLLD